MEVYSAENIRNIVLLGHGGVGKTTIAEQMPLFKRDNAFRACGR